MEKIWILPICLIIVGLFGSLWIYQGTNVKFDFTMDNNTRMAIESLNQTISEMRVNECVLYGFEANVTQTPKINRSENELFINVYRWR